jgi:hypothetical protein
VILAFLALDGAASLLTWRAHQEVDLTYQFATAEPSANISFQALDLHGRTLYAIASGFLYLASSAAFAFGFEVVRRRDSLGRALLSVAFFLSVAYVIAMRASAIEDLRPLVVDRILVAANAHPSVHILPTDVAGVGTFLRWFFYYVDPGPGATVMTLVRLNSVIGLASVGMLLSALASVAVLRGKEKLAREAVHRDLLERLNIILMVLVLGAIVLVVSVAASKLLIEWPTSLLIESQRQAILPLSNALNLLFGAFCTLCLIASLGPALVAFYLDRYAYRENLPVTAQTQDVAGVETGRAKRAWSAARKVSDDLELAPLARLGAAVGVLAPLLTPHVMEWLSLIVQTHP